MEDQDSTNGENSQSYDSKKLLSDVRRVDNVKSVSVNINALKLGIKEKFLAMGSFKKVKLEPQEPDNGESSQSYDREAEVSSDSSCVDEKPNRLKLDIKNKFSSIDLLKIQQSAMESKLERKKGNVNDYQIDSDCYSTDEDADSTCFICRKTFLTYGELLLHASEHDIDKPFSCEHCGKCFKRLNALKIHREMHIKGKPQVCVICDRVYPSARSLKIHMRLTHDELPDHKLHSCTICSKKFKTTSQLKVHSHTHSDLRPYICDICGHCYKNSSTLADHRKIHYPHGCSICKKRFEKVDSLKEHLRSEHGEVKQCICKEGSCEDECESLNPHMQDRFKDNQFVCEFCSKSFSYIGSLRNHLLMHKNQKP